MKLALLLTKPEHRDHLLATAANITFDWSMPDAHGDPRLREGARDPETTWLQHPFTNPSSPSVPAPKPIEDPAEPFFFDQESHRVVGSLEELVIDDRARWLLEGGYARELDDKLARAWDHPGVKQRRRMTGHEQIDSRHCAERAVGRHFDISDHEALFERSTADRRVKSPRVHYIRSLLDLHYPGESEAYPDQGILYELEFGIASQSSMLGQ